MDKTWQTKLVHSDVRVPDGFDGLNVPVYRASTTVFPNTDSVSDEWDPYEHGYTYGLYGTPTTLKLAGRVCELEGGYRTIITPGGQSAISLIHLALLQQGDHVLIPQSIYGPNRKFADGVLRQYGVEVSYYDPLMGAKIAALLQANTRLIWCESPGSVTMEVQDVPAIARAAHEHGALVALDNTWSAGVYFDAFAHGADVTMQALTKYIGGHSDLLLGSVTVRDAELWTRMGSHQQMLGYGASPDDCSLALRGMQTLAVRLQAIEGAALRIARWLAEQRAIERVLHPALVSCPGHEIWKRDFTGSSGVFSVVFASAVSRERVRGFVDALRLFKIGYSWAGVTSLAMAYDLPDRPETSPYGHRIVRLNIGLEDERDLITDLERALGSLSAA